MSYSTVRAVRYVMTIGYRLYKPTQCRATERGSCPEHCINNIVERSGSGVNQVKH